jgi:hypothetical protein
VCQSSDIAFAPEGEGQCRACGARLGLGGGSVCPACGGLLSAEAETCPRCGSPVGIADRVLSQRAGTASPLWLERTRAEAPGLRSAGEKTSQARMDAFVGMDRNREEAVARQQVARAAQDRRLLGIAALAVLAVAILAMALVLAQ